MPTDNDPYLLSILHACATLAPEPLYPARFAERADFDRDRLERALDELRKRGLVKFTDWVKGSGQGYALTETGRQSHQANRLLRIPAPEDQPTASAALSPYERGEMARGVFFEQSTPYAARIILALNLLYFGFGALLATREPFVIGDYLAGDGDTINQVLLQLGALSTPSIVPARFHLDARPQYERLVLFNFLHVGLVHLLMNMYFLTTLGQLIESMWGSVRFLVIYFIAGLVSGCFVVLMQLWQEEYALTAGASGALFGMFAALIVWFVFNRKHLPERVVQGMTRNLGINLFLLTAVNLMPGVSWQGHLGGAMGGLLTALLLHVQRFAPSALVRILALLAVPLVPIGFFMAMWWAAGTQ